ncbi:MAG: hypothetical protein ACM3VS_12940 [Candidatus Dadabacteria bacterium]
MSLPQNKSILNKWILYTSAGWIIGIFLLIGFSSLLEGVKFAGQSPVAIGMGAGIGFMQWMVLRKHAHMPIQWFWFTIIGLTIPYLLFDLASAYIIDLKPENFIPLVTIVGALLVSWLQYQYILRNTYDNSVKWILYNSFAWLIAAGVTFGGFEASRLLKMDRAIAVPLAFFIVVIGGPILGFISGPNILSILKHRRSASEPVENPGSIKLVNKPGESVTSSLD